MQNLDNLFSLFDLFNTFNNVGSNVATLLTDFDVSALSEWVLCAGIVSWALGICSPWDHSSTASNIGS